MIHVLIANYLEGCETWSRAVTTLWCDQWRLLGAQCEMGLTLWETLLAPHTGKEPRPAPGESAPSVEEVARERLHQGLAPPREIYDVRHRGHIDWSLAPSWSRPADPELFEGCTHEG